MLLYFLYYCILYFGNYKYVLLGINTIIVYGILVWMSVKETQKIN